MIEVVRCTLGACCVDGQCVELMSDDNCLGLGGSFEGVGMACTGGLCPPPCPGDVTGDGAVDVIDLLQVPGVWGVCP